MNNAIKIQNVYKSFKDFSLSNLSFSLSMGYIMGFVGQNGAGKTTTIRLILNMINRDKGFYSNWSSKLFNQYVSGFQLPILFS